jgi:SAM-dependent MidA family methyltransferase
VHSASDEVRAAIAAAGGAIRFDEFMRIALYGERGFYTSGGQAGRRGDFITSPEVGPLFGAVLSRWIEGQWQLLGEPDDFTIVECGAGPGTFARSVLAAAPRWSGRYIAVELSGHQRRQHPDGVRSLEALPRGPLTGVVIANELLDNLPFRLAVFDGGWREVVVSLGRDSAIVETTNAPDPSWGWLPDRVAHGTRLPIQDQASAWVTDACRLVSGAGCVIAFDYCARETADLAGRPWREWLRTYRAHARGEHYLSNPGLQDITAEVCLDQLPAPSIVESQAEFLRRWGIEDLVEEGRRAWTQAASRPDVAALKMRSRARESEALTDSRGLGTFRAASWQVAMGDEHSPQ